MTACHHALYFVRRGPRFRRRCSASPSRTSCRRTHPAEGSPIRAGFFRKLPALSRAWLLAQLSSAEVGAAAADVPDRLQGDHVAAPAGGSGRGYSKPHHDAEPSRRGEHAEASAGPDRHPERLLPRREMDAERDRVRGGQRGEGAGRGPRGRRPGRPRPARVPDRRRAVLRAGVGRGEDPPEGRRTSTASRSC